MHLTGQKIKNMKAIYLLIISLFISQMLQAQVEKKVENTAGNLSTLLTPTELNSVTDLTIAGTMDARDFMTIRKMYWLTTLDLSGISVLAYPGGANGEVYNANEIPRSAFEGCYLLKSVIIPSSITAMGNQVFSHCSHLTSISIPSSVKRIGGNAFDGCSSLTTIALPTSIISLGGSCFYECTSLTSIVIPSSLKTIDDGLFTNCTSLSSITIPPSVKTINGDAFSGCSALTEITLPSSITTIEGGVFSRCGSLSSIIIPDSVTTINGYTFSDCTSLTSITIPTSVKSIKWSAFSSCSALTHVTIPSSVTSIGDNAFSGCNSLTSIIIPPLVTTIEKTTFLGCSKLAFISIPASVTSIGEEAFSGCSSLTSITLPSINAIELNTFKGCSSFTSIVVPMSVRTIKNGAFYSCSNLASVTIPSSVDFIGSSAFGECKNLSSIYSKRSIPVDIRFPAFPGVNKLTCILHVPFGSGPLYAEAKEWKEFTNIVSDNQGFSLSTDTIKFNATGGEFQIHITSNIAWQVISDHSWLTINPESGNTNGILTVKAEINGLIPNRNAILTFTSEGGSSQYIQVIQDGKIKVISVTSGNLSFILTTEEKKAITSLTLTGTINANDIFTIQGMPALTELDLTNTTITACSIPEIPGEFHANWFPGQFSSYNPYNSKGLSKPLLKSVKLPSTLEALGCNAFASCTGLTSITIPPSVSMIGYNAFGDCTSLQSINLPSSITGMDREIFGGCTSLTEVIISNSLESINRSTFYGCSSLISVTIPSSVHYIEMTAFAYCTSLSSLILPASVSSIQNAAFFGCKNLATIYSYNPIPISISGAFSGVNTSTCVLYVPFGSKVLYTAADGWKDFKNIVEMAEFRLSPTSLIFESGQGTAKVEITTEVGWTVSSDQPWLTINPASGSGNASVNFTVEANPSVDKRKAEVIFSTSGGTSPDIIVRQKGIPVTINVTAGNLSSKFPTVESRRINYLTITGTMDARDFKFIRNQLPSLLELDLSGATIIAYSGTEGTFLSKYTSKENPEPVNYDYLNNALPPMSFNSMYLITMLQLPASVTSIGDGAFYRCSGMTGFEIPSSVTSIGAMAFEACFSLTSVNIPSSVKYIGERAFRNCTFLTTIYANPVSPPDLTNTNEVFAYVNKNTCTLYVPYGSKKLYAAADQWKDFTNIVEMADAMLSVTNVSVASTPSSQATVKLTTELPWVASYDQTWLTMSPISGKDNQILTFTAKENLLRSSRTTVVSISILGGNSHTITITQEANTSNKVPVANAGANQSVNEGEAISLNGSASSDPDNDVLSYLWTAPAGMTLRSSRAGMTFTSMTAINPTFIAPEVKNDSVIIFKLVVNDGFANSLPSEVKITIKNVITRSEVILANGLKVFPNPTKGIIKIEGLPASMGNKISIYTIDGSLIRMKVSNSAIENIDISDLISGAYVLLINNQKFKIVKN